MSREKQLDHFFARDEADSARLTMLRQIYYDIADQKIIEGGDAARYLANGGSLRQCLHEIVQLEGVTEYEKTSSKNAYHM